MVSSNQQLHRFCPKKRLVFAFRGQRHNLSTFIFRAYALLPYGKSLSHFLPQLRTGNTNRDMAKIILRNYNLESFLVDQFFFETIRTTKLRQIKCKFTLTLAAKLIQKRRLHKAQEIKKATQDAIHFNNIMLSFSLFNALAAVVILFTYVIFILQIYKLFCFTTKLISKYTSFVTSYCRANGGNKTFFFIFLYLSLKFLITPSFSFFPSL